MKNKLSFKFICLLLVFTAFFSFGCQSAKPIEPTEEDLNVVGTVGDYEVYYDELRFAVLTYKEILKNMHGEEIFNNAEPSDKFEEKIRDYVYKNITFNYAVLNLCNEVGIYMDNQILKDAVQNDIENTVKDLGGRGKYKKYLENNFMTDRFFRFNLCIDRMQNELFYVYTDDLAIIKTQYEDVYDIIKNDFVRTQHVFISHGNGKSYADNKSDIESAYQEIINGNDFMSVAKKYGEDEKLSDEGIYITHGYMSDSYEKSAYSLKTDCVSEIIEDSKGFYIIKRLEPDTLYIMTNFDLLKERYQHYAFIDLINKEQSNIKFIPNSYTENLVFLNMK